MTKSAHAAPETQSSRCNFRRPNGQRCRLPISGANSQFCSRHLAAIPRPLYHSIRPTVDDQAMDIDLSSELGIAAPGVFKAPEEIYDFLCKLTYLLSANRISSRRAAILAYITSQAVRTGCVIQKQFDADQKKPPEIVIDVPRPYHDPSDPYEKFAPPADSTREPS
jgi:hypothetical protein